VHVHGARNAAMLISKELAQLIGCGGKALHSAGCSALHMDTAVPLDRKASNCLLYHTETLKGCELP
jgi:hypothetical protein